MSETEKPKAGSIVWRDLTVDDAEAIKDFYCAVVGWKATPFDMGKYNDYNISTPDGKETVAGICHPSGSNANLPPQWLVYVSVENVQESMDRCVQLGGKVIDGPRRMGKSPFCVIQDPAGAVLGLIGPED